MSSEYYPITGVQSPQPHPRLNINDLSSDAQYVKQYHLFLKALSNLQKESEDESNPTGYYQVCGIHGLPYVTWQEPGTKNTGYCAHGNAKFATWHRPYTILFEQRLVEEALKLLSSLPQGDERTLWTDEAQKIRLPFWDWAFDAHIPAAVKQSTVEIELPVYENGQWSTRREILDPNPLSEYRFKDPERVKSDFAPIGGRSPYFLEWQSTRRCPDINGVTQNDVADRQLTNPNDPNAAFKEAMHFLFANIHEFGPFSNAGWEPVRRIPRDIPPDGRIPTRELPTYGSLEDYHGTIHYYSGADTSITVSGHMSVVPLAGFDPLFWLHHSNVDRLYAMWQSLNPQSDFQDQQQNPNQDLSPFNRVPEVRNFWENQHVQKMPSQQVGPTVFDYNYYYPDMPVELKDKPDELRAYVNARFRELYGDHERETFRMDPPTQTPFLDLPFKDGSRFRSEWFVFLRHKAYAITQNFGLVFFFGAPDANPLNWTLAENVVGRYGTFFNEAFEGCENCQTRKANEEFNTGVIPLTRALIVNGVDIYDEDAVEQYLEKNLEWRILTSTCHVEAASEVDLKVGVGSYIVEYPADRALGFVGSGFKFHLNATRNKTELGGYVPGDEF